MTSSKRTVLVVDDDPQVLRAVRRQLKGTYDVLDADSVATAVAAAKGKTIAAMVLDLQLPDGNGLDVVHQLAGKGREIPAVVLSGYLSPASFTLASDAGVVHVLEKGCTADELLEAVGLAIEYGEEGTDGSIRGVSLDDVLRSFHLARRSVSVQVGAAQSGRIDVENGEVVHAQCGDHQGKDALRKLLAQGAVDLRTSKLVAYGPLTVSGPFDDVLRDGLEGTEGNEGGSARPLPSITDDELSERVMPVLERTLVQSCASASLLLARGDGTLVSLHGAEAISGKLAALERLATIGGWQWLLRATEGFVYVATRVAANDLVVAYAPRNSAAIRGQLLTGLRGAVKELRTRDAATKPAPRSTLLVGAGSTSASGEPSDQEADVLCRGFMNDTLGPEVIECRLGSPDAKRWLGRHAAGESSPSERMWWLADDLTRGATGSDLDRLAGGGEADPAQESLVASADHLVFAAPLRDSACSVLAATRQDLALIGRVSSKLRGLDVTGVSERLMGLVKG